MSKSLTKTKSSAPASVQEVKHFSAFAPKTAGLPKGFNAVVGFDKGKRPAWFLFDLYAFWELLCRFDEKLFDALPDEKYDSNPVGKLIDKIEANWPFSKEYREEIRREYQGALKDISAGKAIFSTSLTLTSGEKSTGDNSLL